MSDPGYSIHFDKNVRAILDAYTVAQGHMYPSELREALRMAGMPLDEKLDTIPPPDLPDFSDDAGVDYQLTEGGWDGDAAAT